MKKWYVITGAPCSGKTTILKLLSEKGYTVFPEVAREFIDELIKQGKTIEEIRSDEILFQEKILELKIEKESILPDSLIFFDRGIPDTHAYLRFLGVLDSKILDLSLVNHYVKVFILDPCEYKSDYARTETKEDQEILHNLLQEAYKKSGAMIISVPVFDTKDARVDFILKNI